MEGRTRTPVLRLRLISRRPGRWASRRDLFGVVVWVSADNIGYQGVEQAKLSVIAPENVQLRVQSRGWDTGREAMLMPNAEPEATFEGKEAPSHAHESWIDLPQTSPNSTGGGPRSDTRVLFILPAPGIYQVNAKLEHELADPVSDTLEIEVPVRTELKLPEEVKDPTASEEHDLPDAATPGLFDSTAPDNQDATDPRGLEVMREPDAPKKVKKPRRFKKPKKVKQPKPAKPAKPAKAPREPGAFERPSTPVIIAALALLVAVGALVRAATVANNTPPSIVNVSGQESDLTRAAKPSLQICAPQLNKKWVGGPRDQAPHYSRDPFGIVRLDGEALCQPGGDKHNSTEAIFTLPPGFRPVRPEFQVVRADGGSPFADSLVITLQGQVYPEAGANTVYLGGISFRCGPSGQNGCP